MPSAAQLRQQIEAGLSARIPAALSPRSRTAPPRVPCGIAELDAVLGGGVAEGAISEVVGPECSGRTTLGLAVVASAMRSGRVAAWIDVDDRLDPESAVANGVDLERLLWVRCGGAGNRDQGPGTRFPAVVAGVVEQARVVGGGGSPHPRSEGRGMPQAISAMLPAHGGLYDKHVGRRAVGTPGAPNRVVTLRPVAEERVEQAASDRLPARRGENLPLPKAGPSHPSEPRPFAGAPGRAQGAGISRPARDGAASGLGQSKRPWDRLDQALRAADLLLQGGGFGVMVLDLGSTPAEMAWRIPLATWFRFRAACERTRVSLVLLTQHPCARSSAELVVRMSAGQMKCEGRVMTGMRFRVERERQRFESENKVVSIRKPPRSEHAVWTGRAAWASRG